MLRNDATGRCLVPLPWSMVQDASGTWNSHHNMTAGLLPCENSSASQQQWWKFDKGAHTITSITSVSAGLALAISNRTLYSAGHLKDQFQVSDAAYGAPVNQRL
jgi:hypothetical protein